MQLQLHYTNYTSPQLQLHYTTTNYSYSCTTPHYIQQLWVRWPTRWPLQPLRPLQKTQLQPPFGPSVDSLCHPWFTTTNLSYRFPVFETSATALCGTTGNFLIFSLTWSISVPVATDACISCLGFLPADFFTLGQLQSRPGGADWRPAMTQLSHVFSCFHLQAFGGEKRV